jgi:F-type H+-transporting ATPase subunit epsilon
MFMSKTFKLQVVAPDLPSIEEEVTLVVLPGEMGEFGVMAGHMPFFSTLKPGTMRIVKGQTREIYYLAGGFAEVNPTSVIVLAEEQIKAEAIDVEETLRNKKLAEERLTTKKEGLDLKATELVLARAVARLKVVEEAKSLKK